MPMATSDHYVAMLSSQTLNAALQGFAEAPSQAVR